MRHLDIVSLNFLLDRCLQSTWCAQHFLSSGASTLRQNNRDLIYFDPWISAIWVRLLKEVTVKIRPLGPIQVRILRGTQGEYCLHHMEKEVSKIPLKNLKICSAVGPYLRYANVVYDSKIRQSPFLEEETRAQRNEVSRSQAYWVVELDLNSGVSDAKSKNFPVAS